MIELTDVRKVFGTTPVLKGVSLRFAEGSVTALIGPSSSGKSSLLRRINLLEPPTSGLRAARRGALSSSMALPWPRPARRARPSSSPRTSALGASSVRCRPAPGWTPRIRAADRPFAPAQRQSPRRPTGPRPWRARARSRPGTEWCRLQEIRPRHDPGRDAGQVENGTVADEVAEPVGRHDDDEAEVHTHQHVGAQARRPQQPLPAQSSSHRALRIVASVGAVVRPYAGGAQVAGAPSDVKRPVDDYLSTQVTLSHAKTAASGQDRRQSSHAGRGRSSVP